MTNTTEMPEKIEYVTTREECQRKIEGVCPGCGGEIEPIETVDNSDNPTFWPGCLECQRFCGGVKPEYWRIARGFVEKGRLLPYHHLSAPQWKGGVDNDEYLNAQCSGLSPIIAEIHEKLKEEFNNDKQNRNAGKDLGVL